MQTKTASSTGYILARFGKRVSAARSRYRQFVEKETGKKRRTVRARSVLCYWAVGELRMSMTGLSAQLKISVNCVSQSVARGKIFAKMNDYSLTEYKD
jgi:hypothetical protein